MIVCQVCGTSNAAGERFCAQCGAFLEWDGARVDEPGAAATTGPSPAGAAPAATESPASTGAPVGAGTPAVAAVPVRGGGPRPNGGEPAAGASADTGPAGAAEPTAAQPAEVRPTEVRPTEVRPSEVRPGAPRRQRAVTPPPPAPVRAPREGDLACGGCRAGNEPTRRFCRSCGASLAAAATV
ncbi:MAG TPA: hypothetical protein VNV66_08215, partial [Pilimelia sp.]|nr:hypothetical protein [Pilimelia sp.]